MYYTSVFQSPGSIALELGPLTVRWYGIIIASGILLCYRYITAEMRRRKLDQKPMDDMAAWLIVSGILGARLYYVLFNAGYYFENPAQIFKIWQGGLAIHGAILGGALAYAIFTWRKKIPFLLYADIIMPGVLLAQSIGRWGNFFNNEAFGGPTNLPWKLYIPQEFRPTGLEDFAYYHPTFLYESLWNLAGFALLAVAARHVIKVQAKFSGTIFFSYLAWYSFGRFFIESMRTDSLYFGNFRAAQMISILLFVVGIGGICYKKLYGKKG